MGRTESAEADFVLSSQRVYSPALQIWYETTAPHAGYTHLTFSRLLSQTVPTPIS